MIQKVPTVKDLVLVGGGHTHVEVLRSFGMKPLPGVRLTLVTRDMHTPYSGMLPGFISGFYSYDDCHIDLARLASFAKARLIHEEASGIDIKGRHILFANRPALEYDVLSINVGITPAASLVPGAQQYTTSVKPIDRFVTKLEALLELYRQTKGTMAGSPMRIAVVGGGAGGVEVALSLQFRLEAEREALGMPESNKAQITLVCRGELMAGRVRSAVSAFRRICAERGLQLVEGDPVVEVRADGAIALASGRELPPHAQVLWCTQASAAGWLAGTGLPTDAAGFLAVDACLRSAAGPAEVFAAGDVASCAAYPRPKAGVFAVRQGPPLAHNLRAYLTGQPLVPYVPQSTSLSLVSTGNKYCIGMKGWFAMEAAWLWGVKDNIDRTFMRKYGDDLALMEVKMMASSGSLTSTGGAGAPQVYTAAGAEALTVYAESKMRCGGCGSKVGSSVLSRVLARLREEEVPVQHPASGSAVVVGLDSPDDAALVRPPPPGYLLLQTVDFFRSFYADPFVFGQISANHALGDCFAMGGRPVTALAMAVVPFGPEGKMEDELFQMMAGASRVLREASCALVGGHSCEGEEASLGFTINGEVEETQVMRKSGLRVGQALLLTKALGTGTIMAAAMQGKAKGRWVSGALEAMQQCSGAAAAVMSAHGCTGCTDVTGFGLLGHVAEMAKASQVGVLLDLNAVPVIPGALDCIAADALSSLHTQNAVAVSLVSNFERELKGDARWPILVDPQTAGGLLGGVPLERAQAALEALRKAGYVDAAMIGRIVEQPSPQAVVEAGSVPACIFMGSTAP